MSDASSDKNANQAQDHLLQQLGGAFYSCPSAFCCACSVPIAKESSFEKIKDDVTDRQLVSSPIVIRWDHKDTKAISKLTLPLNTDADAEAQGMLQHLLDNCEQATFGKDGKDFSTNFNPYDTGIIGAVAQTLLPGIARSVARESDEHAFIENLGVVAELYKLNVEVPNSSLYVMTFRSSTFQQVYSGPSGKFKPHVDTPRGATQFASLVVCLPFRFQGGQLRIAHVTQYGSQNITYDWSDQDTDIKWAAFYSDCEHEVFEVLEGHRITLSYNLYAHEQLGGVFRGASTIDANSFTLYHRIKEALASPDFFPKRGTLGFHCVHAYAHTNDRVIRTLPYTLKGADAVVFSLFHKLGLSVALRDVMEDLHDPYEDERTDTDSDMEGAKLVSTGLNGLIIASDGEEEDSRSIDVVPYAWDSEWRSDIHWFGGARNKEIAIVHLAYGNQASTVWHYSTAAILVKIPKKDSEKRRALVNQ